MNCNWIKVHKNGNHSYGKYLCTFLVQLMWMLIDYEEKLLSNRSNLNVCLFSSVLEVKRNIMDEAKNQCKMATNIIIQFDTYNFFKYMSVHTYVCICMYVFLCERENVRCINRQIDMNWCWHLQLCKYIFTRLVQCTYIFDMPNGL